MASQWIAKIVKRLEEAGLQGAAQIKLNTIEFEDSIHEMFRREIVKSVPRDIYHEGIEHHVEGFDVEEIVVDTICDGCLEAVESGSKARLHRRTGELYCYCYNCSGRAVA